MFQTKRRRSYKGKQYQRVSIWRSVQWRLTAVSDINVLNVRNTDDEVRSELKDKSAVMLINYTSSRKY